MKTLLAILLLATLAFSQGISYPPAKNGLTERDVTGTTATDTILSADCGNPVMYTGSVAVGITLPTATTLGNAYCAFTLTNQTSGSATALTVTPTTWSIVPASAGTITQGSSCRYTVNQAGNGWIGVCHDLPLVAGTSITITRGQYGPTIASTASGTGTVTVVSSGSLTNTAVVTGGGTTTLQTPSSTTTLDASGNLSVAAGGSVGSADTGTPKFTFATNKATFNQPLYLGTTSNQVVLGTTTNLTTLNFQQPSGAVTLTFPLTSQLMLGGNSDTTTTHVCHATAVAGICNFAALAAGDLPSTLSSGTAITNASLTTPNIGAASGTSLALSATTNQLVLGSTNTTTLNFGAPASSITVTGPIVASGLVYATAQPAAGFAKFSGSTYATTSAAIAASDLPATPLNNTTCATGSHHVMTAPREYFFGTTATDCYVDFPAPAAGYEFCVRTANNVTAKIHLAALGSSRMYELVNRQGYGTATTGTLDTATGAYTNQICLLGVDSTHYAIMSFTGDFANN